MKDNENKAVWVDQDDEKYKTDSKEFNTVSDIRVAGTPTMLYVDEKGDQLNLRLVHKCLTF